MCGVLFVGYAVNYRDTTICGDSGFAEILQRYAVCRDIRDVQGYAGVCSSVQRYAGVCGTCRQQFVVSKMAQKQYAMM